MSRQKGTSSARELRNLRRLEGAASSSRALNLLAVWRRCGADPEYSARPFFRNTKLNRCLILKHRYRPGERDTVRAGDATGTKIILPFDLTDLGAGAHSFFIHQRGYLQFLDQVAGHGRIDPRDVELLEILHRLPSLDPFVMRERLKQSGFEPARCYFDLTESDTAEMIDFVREELRPLIALCFGQADDEKDPRAAKLAEKVMRNAGDKDLAPLRTGLRISGDAFDECLFCWTGFIYYKWSLNRLMPQITPVAAEIAAAKASGEVNANAERYIEAARVRLKQALGRACGSVGGTLMIYDHAYAELTRNGQPKAFREFLLRAPGLFHDLGDQLDAIQHILNFWRYRFPKGMRSNITGDELSDILADFEMSLNFDKRA